MVNRRILLSSLYLIFFLTLQCVTYTQFPAEKIDRPPKPINSEEILYYKILDQSNVRFLGGVRAMEKVVKKKGVYKNTESVEEDQKTGKFIKITIKHVDPHLPALIFGYISLSFLTIFPFWSTEEGYDILFEVYRDGVKKKSFEYEIRRSGFFWIAMLPFAWINFFTYSEAEAFEATTFKFFEDAQNVLTP